MSNVCVSTIQILTNHFLPLTLLESFPSRNTTPAHGYYDHLSLQHRLSRQCREEETNVKVSICIPHIAMTLSFTDILVDIPKSKS